MLLDTKGKIALSALLISFYIDKVMDLNVHQVHFVSMCYDFLFTQPCVGLLSLFFVFSPSFFAWKHNLPIVIP